MTTTSLEQNLRLQSSLAHRFLLEEGFTEFLQNTVPELAKLDLERYSLRYPFSTFILQRMHACSFTEFKAIEAVLVGAGWSAGSVTKLARPANAFNLSQDDWRGWEEYWGKHCRKEILESLAEVSLDFLNIELLDKKETLKKVNEYKHLIHRVSAFNVTLSQIDKYLQKKPKVFYESLKNAFFVGSAGDNFKRLKTFFNDPNLFALVLGVVPACVNSTLQTLHHLIHKSPMDFPLNPLILPIKYHLTQEEVQMEFSCGQKVASQMVSLQNQYAALCEKTLLSAAVGKVANNPQKARKM